MSKKKPTSKKLPSKKEAKITLTIRAHEPEEIKTMNEILKATMQKTFSGALMSAAQRYPEALKTITKLREERDTAFAKVKEVTEVVDNWLSSQNNIVRIGTAMKKEKHRPYPIHGE